MVFQHECQGPGLAYTEDNNFKVRLFDLVNALARSLDMVSHTLAGHHTNVGFFAARIAECYGLSSFERRNVVFAAMLHDIGAVSLYPAVDSLLFEDDTIKHSIAGSVIISSSKKLQDVSKLVEYHHTPWEELRGENKHYEISNIINLADFIDVNTRRDRPARHQIPILIDLCRKHSGKLFNPDYIEALREAESKRDYYHRLYSERTEKKLRLSTQFESDMLDAEGVLDFTGLFAKVIDFRSRFTATHSQGVAITSSVLGRWLGFNEVEQALFQIAGRLHDIGKLAVPTTLLEKNDKLTSSEFSAIQRHAVYTEHILSGVPGLEVIRDWACQHHERIDGTGYPKGIAGKEISLGSRILQVADVFTAITEDRPYRRGMDFKQTTKVLRQLGDSNKLDPIVVEVLIERYDEINDLRCKGQTLALEHFSNYSKVLYNKYGIVSKDIS
ncbi:HD domain-containing phosphohydrolase [Halodesulfovibrio aestuarii]|uniref:HD domain-containing phosphohydrolase n=1 Tax=Halodesulfovibrio aestuarii TaxID=126333 RepID=UPI0003F65617